MPNESDGVYLDDLGNVGTTGRAGLTVASLIARIAGHATVTVTPRGGADTRQAPMPQGVLYENVDHPTLKAMVTENVDPDQVGVLASGWQEAGAKLTQFQDDVAGAINSSRDDWQGAAGEAAREFMINVGRWIGDAGRGAELAGTQAAKQSEALAAAKNAMPDPVKFDVDAANAELRQITDPVTWISRYADHMKAYAAQQAAQQRAAEVVTTYDAALAESGTMPAFAPPPAMSGAGAPMPRTPQDGTSPMSASPGMPTPIKSPESAIPDETPPQAAAIAPFGGGFAPLGAPSPRSMEHAVPGALAAQNYLGENYLLEGDRTFGTNPTTPPVIGG
ncbi:hypothetical protein LWC34_21680 [Kibdelosporangium philippinense]|uniref:PPE domain-containing protein n=1 Tax=Kibdelosporangium philippinense TaxID=211113 RepID=A0ABS8ZC26_9PSEU|nr:hypothetical protein [Kibdelosporangium philippinense]MCE7005419.1 hypothetical protein [Kibdelosporangium philippinense]